MRGLGAEYYCTPEGGSGFITSAQVPTLPTFDITQLSPVYDQPTGWLRNTVPGSFTYYPRFGPPYSYDGGVQAPFAAPHPSDTPAPVQTSGGDLVLRRADVVAPMPSIIATAAQTAGCGAAADQGAGGDVTPLLAIGLILVAAVLLGGGR